MKIKWNTRNWTRISSLALKLSYAPYPVLHFGLNTLTFIPRFLSDLKSHEESIRTSALISHRAVTPGNRRGDYFFVYSITTLALPPE